MQRDAERVPNTFGSAVRRAREQAGMSQRTLASRVSAITGVRLDPSAVTRLETNQREPRVIEAQAIAAALSVDLNQLLPPTDNRTSLHALWMALDDAKFELVNAVHDYGTARRELAAALGRLHDDQREALDNYEDMSQSAQPRAIADWPSIRADIVGRTADRNPPFDDQVFDAEA